MANSLGNGILNKAVWAPEMQYVFFKDNVATKVANLDLRDQLSSGDTVHKPYRSFLRSQTYTKGSSITAQDISGTDEYLLVNTAEVVPFYLDDIDRIQNSYPTMKLYARDAGRLLANRMDQVIISEVTNAANTIYNADIGGSGATTAIPLTTANVFSIFTSANRKLTNQNAKQLGTGMFAICSPRVIETLRLTVAGRETAFGDQVGDNGYVGNRFGFEIYESNNCPFSAVWTPNNNPINADTITIAGVTFTFVTNGTAANPGEISIGGNTAATITSLVQCINNTGTAGASNYIALTDASGAVTSMSINHIVATDGTTYLGIAGFGDIVVAGSDAADVWSAQVQHLMFGMKKAVDFVLQRTPDMKTVSAQDKLGDFVYPWMLYGKKTFKDMTRALVNVVLDASAWQ